MTFNGNLTIVSQLLSETELPEQGVDSVSESIVTFLVSRSVTEIVRECIPYWIVVVSVVAGLLLLMIIITVFACVSSYSKYTCTLLVEVIIEFCISMPSHTSSHPHYSVDSSVAGTRIRRVTVWNKQTLRCSSVGPYLLYLVSLKVGMTNLSQRVTQQQKRHWKRVKKKKLKQRQS